MVFESWVVSCVLIWGQGSESYTDESDEAPAAKRAVLGMLQG